MAAEADGDGDVAAGSARTAAIILGTFEGFMT